MPQQPPTTFRIEDLRARLKLEPKSRLFYPLAEELRKINRFDDAEKVLRQGLNNHGSYTSAWVSLGRVLFEQKKYGDAIDALQRAGTLDPGNVVAARLLAESYLELGEKVEAIKKFKLVRALLPADGEVQEAITRLEIQLQKPVAVSPAEEPPPPAAFPSPAGEEEAPTHPVSGEPVSGSERATDTEKFLADEPVVPLAPPVSAEGPVQAVDVDAALRGGAFTGAADRHAEEIVSPRSGINGERAVEKEEERDFPVASGQGMREMTDFEPAARRIATVEEPFSAVDAPKPSEAGSAGGSIFDETHPFAPPPAPPPVPGPPFATPTIAELYASQGHHEDARQIYTKLDSSAPGLRQGPGAAGMAFPSAAETDSHRHRESVARLQSWLTRVTRK